MNSRTLLLALALMGSSQLALAAEKLLTVGGAVTEIVFALGKGDEVIANDITSVYPEAAFKLPKVVICVPCLLKAWFLLVRR
ncbi:hypothetical protein [Methylobacillus glycogenes]|uniref:hypothetical protein n=1 Tax=Methylobacillus glycogenes TaxID=406 RepID=UPI000685D819|nr:hypothetical protein [Methylobacillus glycogenes]